MDKSKRQKIAIQKRVTIPPEEQTTSSLDVGYNGTSAGPPFFNNDTILNRDSTTAPKIGEQEDERGKYAESYAALLDKYALSKLPLSKILIFIILGWVIIQDNGAGKLSDWQGMLWTLKKLGVFLAVLCSLSVGHYVYQRIIKKF